MIVYTPKISSRFTYVLEHIFKQILEVEFSTTLNKDEFIHSTQKVKISFGEKFDNTIIYIPKLSNLLFEKEISEQSFLEFVSNLKTNKKDIFTLSFLLLTRYQEYLPFKADKHKRFPFNEDKIFTFLEVEKPWVDIFAYQLKNEITNRDSDLIFSKKTSKTVSTIDIDRTWLWKGNSFIINTLRLCKHHVLLNKNHTSLSHFFNFRKDRYDVFDYLENIFTQNKTQNIYFFLVGNKSEFDNPNSFSNKKHIAFIQQISKKFKVGIHPSYYSNSQPQQIEKEISILERITQTKVTKSRQHYVKLSFPDTYQNLLKNKITEDYSMGFSDKIGFRAGTSHPLQWFDLQQNKPTTLLLFPFCVMDVTLKNYENLSVEKSIQKIHSIQKEIRNVNGLFIPIFHNQNLTEYGDWKDWRRVFEHCIKDNLTD